MFAISFSIFSKVCLLIFSPFYTSELSFKCLDFPLKSLDQVRLGFGLFNVSAFVKATTNEKKPDLTNK